MSKIKVNGRIEELELLTDNGVDCSDDIMGQNDVPRDEYNIWIMDEETFEWYETLFKLMTEHDALLKEFYASLPLKESFNPSKEEEEYESIILDYSNDQMLLEERAIEWLRKYLGKD